MRGAAAAAATAEAIDSGSVGGGGLFYGSAL